MADQPEREERTDLPYIEAETLSAAWRVEHPVLCIASRSALDEAAAAMLAQLVQKHGLSARVQPFTDVSSAKGFKIDAQDARIVCLSYFGATSSTVSRISACFSTESLPSAASRWARTNDFIGTAS